MTKNFDESVNVNTDKLCKLPKVVNNYPKELASCSRSNNFNNSNQWVGGNEHGDFFMSTCECGKVSTPFFTFKNHKTMRKLPKFSVYAIPMILAGVMCLVTVFYAIPFVLSLLCLVLAIGYYAKKRKGL
jgi:hypothetical protein